MSDKIDPLCLHYARLATATMSPGSIEVFPDGSLCDRQLYGLFVRFKKQLRDRGDCQRGFPTDEEEVG